MNSVNVFAPSLLGVVLLSCPVSAGAATVTLLEKALVTQVSGGELGTYMRVGQEVDLTETFHFNKFEVTGVDGVAGTYSYRFSFEIDGVIVAGVHTIDGLESETDVVEYKDGDNHPTHTRPGNHKPGKMTCSRDWSNTSEWYKWRFTKGDGATGEKVSDVDSFAKYFSGIKFDKSTADVTDESGGTMSLSIVSSQPVPEPATCLILVAGLAAFARKRR